MIKMGRGGEDDKDGKKRRDDKDTHPRIDSRAYTIPSPKIDSF